MLICVSEAGLRLRLPRPSGFPLRPDWRTRRSKAKLVIRLAFHWIGGAASPPCDAVEFSGCAAPEGCSPAADSSTWAASTAAAVCARASATGAAALLRTGAATPATQLRCGGGAGKLALLDALVDDDGEIAAGGVDDRGQALRGRLDEEEELREELFLARQGGELP